MNPRTERVLEYVLEHSREYGTTPTLREIGAACDIPSTSVVNYHLNRLMRLGLLERRDDISRGLRIPGMRSVLEGQPVTVRTADGSLVTGELVAEPA